MSIFQQNSAKVKKIINFSRKRLTRLANEAHVTNWEKYLAPKNQLNDLNQVMWQFSCSLQNRQHASNVIKIRENEKVLRKILFNFDPHTIYRKYQSSDEVYAKFLTDLKINPLSKTWKDYAKYLCSAANFLNKFKDVNDFKEFLNKFSYNTYTKTALPMLLDKEIEGFGFALACDCLKELGFKEYPKPDVHIIAILEELGFLDKQTKSSEKPYQTYKIIIEMAEQAENCSAYCLDKLLWLNCTGKFYEDFNDSSKGPLKIKKANTSREEFISELKKELNKKF